MKASKISIEEVQRFIPSFEARLADSKFKDIDIRPSIAGVERDECADDTVATFFTRYPSKATPRIRSRFQDWCRVPQIVEIDGEHFWYSSLFHIGGGIDGALWTVKRTSEVELDEHSKRLYSLAQGVWSLGDSSFVFRSSQSALVTE